MCTDVLFQNSLYHFVVEKKTQCIQGKYSPILYLPLLTSSAGKFQTSQIGNNSLTIVSIKKNIFQTTVSGQIQDRAKPFTSVEGQNEMGKNNPVYISHSYSNNKMTFQNQTSHHQTINISS